MADYTDAHTSLTGLGCFIATVTSTVVLDVTSIVVGGQTMLARVTAGATYNINDVVLCTRVMNSQIFILSKLYAAPTPETNNDSAPDTSAPTQGQLIVTPVETRTWDSDHSSWTRRDDDNVYQGEYANYGLNTGCVFYGTKPSSLAGKTVTSAYIKVRRVQGGNYAASAATLRLMTNKVRPSGAPTLTSSTTGPSLAVGSTNNAFAIPTSWAQALVDGTSGGLAVSIATSTPYLVFAGRAAWSGAFVLTLNWTS